MAREKKTAVSPYERKRWLEQLDSGMGITKIAKSAGRDIRIVKDHIEIAREEVQAANVRREFLLKRLEDHQNDLLAESGRIRHMVGLYPPGPLTPEEPVQRKIHEALGEHIRGSRLVRLLESFDNLRAENNEERDRIRKVLQAKEKELVSTLVEVKAWTAAIVGMLESGVLSGEGEGFSYEKGRTADGRFIPTYWQGTHSLTKTPVSGPQADAVIKAHEEFVTTGKQFATVFADYRQRLKTIGDGIIDELDVFSLKRMLPGKCRYCPI